MVLETLIQDALQAKRQAEASEEQRKGDDHQLRLSVAAEALQVSARVELGAEVAEALQVVFIGTAHNGKYSGEGRFRDGDLVWRFGLEERAHRTVGAAQWWARAERDKPGLHSAVVTFSAEAGQFKLALLAGIGEAREREAEAQALREREAAEAQAMRDQWARQQAEAEALLADIKATDASIRQQIDEITTDAVASMWRWPDGVIVPLYLVTWMKAAAYDSDNGALDIEHDQGWATVDHLDGGGYITVYPFNRFSYPGAQRTIKLMPDIHRPIWERRLVGSLDELPDELRTELVVSIPNISTHYHRSEPFYRFEDGGMVEFEVDDVAQPLPWVREYVERIASGEQR